MLSHALVSDQLRDYGMYVESVIFTDGTTSKSVPTEAEALQARKQVEENRAAAKKAAEEAAKEAKIEAKIAEPPPSDSPWDYLTPDERTLHPELANPPAETKEAAANDAGKTEAPVKEPHKGEQHSPRR